MAACNPPEPFLEVEFEEATKYVRAKVAATGSQEDLLYLYARYAALFIEESSIKSVKTEIAGSSKQRRGNAQWRSPLSISLLRNPSGMLGKNLLAWGEQRP